MEDAKDHMKLSTWSITTFLARKAGADPGFFLGGSAPLRNDVFDGEVKKGSKASTCIRRRKLHLGGGGGVAHPPPAPSP